jgi:hypothetical protein
LNSKLGGGPEFLFYKETDYGLSDNKEKAHTFANSIWRKIQAVDHNYVWEREVLTQSYGAFAEGRSKHGSLNLHIARKISDYSDTGQSYDHGWWEIAAYLNWKL